MINLTRQQAHHKAATAALFLLMIAAGGVGASAQSSGSMTPPQPQPAEIPIIPAPSLPIPTEMAANLATPEAPDSYLIGPGDLLSIFVFQIPQLTRQVRVSEEGQFTLPFIPSPILASGLTARELGKRIATSLVEQQLATDPTVDVVVRQVMSKPVVVGGEVYNPVTLQAARPLTLREALARAGGIRKDAGDQVVVTQRKAHRTRSETYSLTAILDGGEGANLRLDGNNSVTVLPAKLVYVVGSVHQAGAFPLRPGEPIGVIQAIALAQGFSSAPEKDHAVIIRSQGDRRTEIPVNIEKILQRKAPNVRLVAGDILYVPKNGKHEVMVEALRDAGQAAVIFAGYHIP